MKKTLYQILGVDPKASAQDIEAAYAMRLEELKMATIQDPNKLVVLQQSRAVLCDPAQRAVYDVSISEREAHGSSRDVVEAEPTFMRRWGKWIAIAVVLIVVVLWARPGAVPPPQVAPGRPSPGPGAARVIESAPQPAQLASEPAAVTVDPKSAVASASPSQPPADSSTNALLGEWSCTDAISGRTSKYNFQQDGVLSITPNEGPPVSLKFEVKDKVLTLTDPKQVSTLVIEELVARKMILNTGVEGRRLACKS